MAKAKKKAKPEGKTYGAKLARELEQERVDELPVEEVERLDVAMDDPPEEPLELAAPPEPLPAQLGDQFLIPGIEPDPEPDAEKPRYAFPTAVRCPRCQTLDNERYSQNEETQYRRCRRPVCKKLFHVTGKRV